MKKPSTTTRAKRKSAPSGKFNPTEAERLRRLNRHLAEHGVAPTEEESRAMGFDVAAVQAEPVKVAAPHPDRIEAKSMTAKLAVAWVEQAGSMHPEIAGLAVRALVDVARSVVDALDRLGEANPGAVRSFAQAQTSWPVVWPVMPAAAEAVVESVRALGLGGEAVNIKPRGRPFDLKTPEIAVVVRIVREVRGIRRAGPTAKQDPQRFKVSLLKAARAEFIRKEHGCDREDLAGVRRKAEAETKRTNPGAKWQVARKLLLEAFERLYG